MINTKIVIKCILVSLINFLLIFSSGCSFNTYYNSKLDETKDISAVYKASNKNDQKMQRGNKDSLVILALSGGGSRAAYWSASIMLKLGDLLKEVDIISSVSGGSLPAAYYALSYDDEPDSSNTDNHRIWNETIVKDLMSRSYRTRWVWNLLWPSNIIKTHLTNYDRTDIMAQTLMDNLFDASSFSGNDLQFKDLNPQRPLLMINATRANISDDFDKAGACQGSIDEIHIKKNGNNNTSLKKFGGLFTFTKEDFSEIGSDLASYDIGRAVMASATFPGLFHDVTLKNFNKSNEDTGCERYLHLFDGGNVDNLGLKAINKVIDKEKQNYDKIIVILIDAFTDGSGWSSSEDNPRHLQGWALDPNVFHSIDSLLGSTRGSELALTKKYLSEFSKKNNHKSIFYHIQFSNIDSLNNADRNLLFKELNNIPTDFNISDEHIKKIDEAVDLLFDGSLKKQSEIKEKNICLKNIANLVWHNQTNEDFNDCTYLLQKPKFESINSHLQL